MCTSWGEIERAYNTRSSILDLVTMGAPMAHGTPPKMQGGFSVKVERLGRGREPRAQRVPQLSSEVFDGFGGGLANKIAQARDARDVHSERDISEAQKRIRSYER